MFTHYTLLGSTHSWDCCIPPTLGTVVATSPMECVVPGVCSSGTTSRTAAGSGTLECTLPNRTCHGSTTEGEHTRMVTHYQIVRSLTTLCGCSHGDLYIMVVEPVTAQRGNLSCAVRVRTCYIGLVLRLTHCMVSRDVR